MTVQNIKEDLINTVMVLEICSKQWTGLSIL